jgi:hypothetical protein
VISVVLTLSPNFQILPPIAANLVISLASS